MASVNKVILVGNLGADPETRYMPSGDAVTNFRIATTDRYKDKQSGEIKEVTEWHRIGTFGRVAENCGQYLKKGSSVYIEGRLRTRKWQDGSGQDKYSTEIVADRVQFISTPRGDDDGDQQQGQSSRGQQRPSQNAQHQQGNRNAYADQRGGGQPRQPQQGQQGGQQRRQQQAPSNGFEDMDDDIPF